MSDNACMVVSPRPQNKKKIIIATLVLLMILACGSLDRLQTFNRQSQTQPTQTLPKRNALNIAQAYAKMQTLPGYFFENRQVVRDSRGHQTEQIVSGEVDAQGNLHFFNRDFEGRQQEIYIIEPYVYVFEPEFQGWMTTPRNEWAGGSHFTELPAIQELIQLTTQTKAAPIKENAGIILDRPSTRYTVAGTIQMNNRPVELRGTFWIDDETDALIKAETFFYRNSGSLPDREFTLTISQIGATEPIRAPMPVIDPTAATGAEATAQALVIFPAKINYRGEVIHFELMPVRVTHLSNTAPRQAKVEFLLRGLPDSLFVEKNAESFLAQLKEKLTLSIPEQNLIITSSGFEFNTPYPDSQTLQISYFFNADLENLDHVEVILAGPGNPLFMPVPVE